MSYIKITSIVLLQLFLITGVPSPNIVFAGDSSHKIVAEHNPQHIRANHPFKLTFSYHNPDAHNTVSSKIAIQIPYDFKVIAGPNTSISKRYVTKEKVEESTSWTYTLVAKRTGEILFLPWSLTLSNNEVYTSDSVWVHVYDEFISTEDSIKKLTASSVNRKDIDSLNRNTTLKTSDNEYYNAIIHFDSIIELNSNDANAYYQRGNVYLENGANKHAIQDFEAAIKLNPKLAEAYNNHALAKINIDDYNGVLLDYNKAIELDSGMFATYANRGRLKIEFKDYTGALNDLNKAIELYPKGTLFYLYRGMANELMGDYSHALVDFNRVIAVDSTIPAAF
ncbi:MAG: tetratricopeptide repeat protein, partial [Bacteroidota bacterium]